VNHLGSTDTRAQLPATAYSTTFSTQVAIRHSSMYKHARGPATADDRQHCTITHPTCTTSLTLVRRCISCWHPVYRSEHLSHCSCHRSVINIALHVFTEIQHHHHNSFMALFLGSPGWAGARRELLEFMVKGRLTEADTLTIQLGATPSGLTSVHLHHPPFSTGRMPFLSPNQQCQSTEGN